MSKEVAQFRREIRRIKAEIIRYEQDPDRKSGRLLLLVAKNDLTTLIGRMRRQQEEIKVKRSRKTKANQVASAYANLNQYRKYNKG
ncbi:hypothetical protein [uncultured Cohaesibacter sp.]|uniref:hypothetical protein n=1 Tax=uncultured Cohaesibacter sp. TaxID=1002546 RepID=UPI0029C8EE98|nr:hypothetical protein [uncultured Cohaesibacter sp.]